jgi:hypothetical protein
MISRTPRPRRTPECDGRRCAPPQFIEFGSSGRVFDKQQIIDALRGEATTARRSVLDFRISTLVPGIALAMYWLIGERWQMVFHQGTASRAS